MIVEDVDRWFRTGRGRSLQFYATDAEVQSWLTSVLTPNLPIRRGMPIANGLLSFNGLVHLQHGLMVRDEREPARPLREWPSNLGIVGQVQNFETGEVRSHPGYMRIYDRLRKTIRKSLRIPSIVRFLDGHEEESRLVLWTEAAVRAYENGFPYYDRPASEEK